MAEEPAEPDTIIRMFGGLVSLLRERLSPEGIRVDDIAITADVEDLSRRLREGEVDLVVETVFASQLLKERSGCLEPRLVLVRDGQREYRSVFFTRRDSPIQRLADLRGGTLVLEAPRSTSAFALPVAALGRVGIATVSDTSASAGSRDVRYVLAGGEINQAVWVAHGRGDAGAFNEGDWDALPSGIRDQLRIFHRTSTILRGLLSFRTGTDPRLRERTEELLLSLHDDPGGGDALDRARITRFERLTEGDRSELRAWEETLRTVAFSP
jgi:phosphonate transport system substrate-binding protein